MPFPVRTFRLAAVLATAATLTVSPIIASAQSGSEWIVARPIRVGNLLIAPMAGKSEAAFQREKLSCASQARGSLDIFAKCMMLMRNRVDYAGNAPITAAPVARVVAPPAPPPVSAASQAYAQILDRIVAQDSKSWLAHRYRPGSISNVTVGDAGSTVRANFQYSSGPQRGGWVEARLRNNKVSCVRYWDFPGECRAVGHGIGRQMEEANAKQQAAWNRLSPAQKRHALAERSRQNEASQDSSDGMGAFFGHNLMHGRNPFDIRGISPF